jgi:hypothetical protein
MKEDTRTISVDSFSGKKNITKEEFVKRWSAPALDNLDFIPGSWSNKRGKIFWHYAF